MSWALTVRQLLPLHASGGVGVSLHEKSHDVPGGRPSVQLLLHQAQPRHRTALCEVTKLLPPRVTGDQDMQGPAGIPWGFRRGPETLGSGVGFGGTQVVGSEGSVGDLEMGAVSRALVTARR